MQDEITVSPLVDILSKQLGKQVVMSGDSYVYHVGLLPVSQSDVDIALLEQQSLHFTEFKNSKINEINTACGNEIVNGFTSDALGSTYHYQSAELDQLNLIGIATAQQDDYFKCGVADADGVVVWNYELHTVAQLIQVLQDGEAHKQVLLQKANDLKVQIANATTLDEVGLIVW